MRFNSLFFLCCAFIFSVFLPACSSHPSPINPNATPEAKALLDKLYRIKGNYVISGQHNYFHHINQSTDTNKVITGKTPLIWGADLNNSRSEYYEQIINEAIRHYNEGYIVTLMCHEIAPKPEAYEQLTNPEIWEGLEKEEILDAWYKMSEDEWMQVVTPGTSLHEQWIKDIDKIAEPLKVLQERNIPILWRPYHEMNGIWFWWGNRRGEEGFTKLWKMMYDRYTHFHKLNNLIWVWNANAPRDWENDEAYDYGLFYPGNDFVDVLAADVYKNDFKQSHHDQLLDLGKGKLIALGEVGVVPSPKVLKEQPYWSWFMVWAEFNWKYNTPEAMNELYNAPQVITLENREMIEN